MDIKQRYKLRKFIAELARVRGRHTELVSVYIPAGYDLNKIIQHLQEEQGTAENIKDKTTRTHVIDSLEKMIRHLRLYKKLPENGLAVFAGNVSEKESKVDIKVWSLEPPEQLKFRLYRCDQTFVLDPLREMIAYKDIYALIVLDNREANIGLLRGTSITEITHMTSGVPGKVHTGGFCLHPDTIIYLKHGYKKLAKIKVGDTLKAYDFKNKKIILTKCTNLWEDKKNQTLNIQTDCSDIIVSLYHILFKLNKNKINKVYAAELNVGDYLVKFDGKKTKILKMRKLSRNQGLIDIETDKGNFIANNLIVHNSQQRYARLREEAAHEFYKRIAEVANKEFLGMRELKGILIGGPGPTKEIFFDGAYLNNELKKKVIAVKDLSYTGESGLHDLVDRSKDVLAKEEVTKEKQIMETFFKLLATDQRKVAYGREAVKEALELGAVDTLLLSESLTDEDVSNFEELADKSGSKVQMITTETREGKQLRDLGGIGAILRFAIK